jgi:hypothetical protein
VRLWEHYQKNLLFIGIEKRVRHLRAGLILASLFVALSHAAGAAVWQYSVAMEAGTDRRAFLWVPENSWHIEGVLLGLQNMLELNMFEDPEIRKACADAGLAIVWISPGAFPGAVTPKPQPELRFEPAPDAYRRAESPARSGGRVRVSGARERPDDRDWALGRFSVRMGDG